MKRDFDARLYGSAIAIVSGVYSIASALTDGFGSMPTNMTAMLVIGLVVLVHGIVLLTPAAERLGRASGPLMVTWAVIMLGTQALDGMSSSDAVMDSRTWDVGMVALAALMLISGLIMSRRNS